MVSRVASCLPAFWKWRKYCPGQDVRLPMWCSVFLVWKFNDRIFLKRNNGRKKWFPFKNKLLMLLWISWWGGEYLEAKQTEPSLSTQNMTRFGTKTSSVGDQYSPKLSQSQFYNYYEMQIMLNTKIKHAPNRVIKIGWAKTNLPTYDYRAKPQFTKPFIVNVTVKIIPHLNTEFQYWNQNFRVNKIQWY